MSTEVLIPTSSRYNAIYYSRNLHAALIELAIPNGYAKPGLKRLSLEVGGGGGRVPPGRNHSFRLLLFYSTTIYYAWLLANVMMAEKFFRRLYWARSYPWPCYRGYCKA